MWKVSENTHALLTTYALQHVINFTYLGTLMKMSKWLMNYFFITIQIEANNIENPEDKLFKVVQIILYFCTI